MTRIFLDACIVIDLVEGSAKQQDQLRTLILGKHVVGSELVRMESRLKALRERQTDVLAIYDQFFASCELVPFDRALFDLTSGLRIEHRLKTPDALHLATAIRGSCGQFWTNDTRLANAAGERLSVFDWARIDALFLESGGT